MMTNMKKNKQTNKLGFGSVFANHSKEYFYCNSQEFQHLKVTQSLIGCSKWHSQSRVVLLSNLEKNSQHKTKNIPKNTDTNDCTFLPYILSDRCRNILTLSQMTNF